MKKRYFLLMPLVLALGGLVACGGSKDPTKSSSPTPSKPVTPTTTVIPTPSVTPTVPVTLSPSVTPTPTSDIPNQEELDAFKALLNKQDLSNFYEKWFGSMYTQEYSILDIENTDEGKITSFFNYTGLGFLDFYYQLSEDDYNSLMDSYGVINIFDAMSKGVGGYRITQLSDAALYNKAPVEESEHRDLSINQSMTLKTTESDVIVDNTLYTSDTNTFEYEKRQEFNGTINKELLFSTVSTRSFRDIFSTVNLFGAPEDIEFLELLYYSTCRNLVDKSDKEISDFIIDKKIKMLDGEEYLEVNFSFDGEELEDNDSIPGVINGTLYYDKETGSFEEFSYVIDFINESINEETGDILFSNMKFTCTGKISRESLGSMRTKDDPAVYDDVLTFLEDVREKVVPPTIY